MIRTMRMNDDLNNRVDKKQGQMVVSVSAMKVLAAALRGGGGTQPSDNQRVWIWNKSSPS